ncbi:protein sey1 [Terfezia boudieri ATCC MYA-4762]|uniref:Protein sey1 n=1 Tax=Terfezia boudieri ATCC MYA-4762 TaxID=1051890 RepID=A0A3N4LBB8_9PEZI|nr:protein sey1 [Terfezia boudieri ATCC MYA-4762]
MSPSGTLRRRPIGSTGSRAEKEDDYESGIQVIDENKEFTPNMSKFLSIQGLLAAGFNYHLVAVFGSQSTGKSTLLNHLFGTSFTVMNEKARKQTTKGIWMSRAEGEDGSASNILVMDVEGTDGRERGEDQDFERKSALFALATSEVMIVNIWEHQVGLYQGANMGLLKTVFEVNLQLFQKNQTTSQRSLLFFVIRDHVGHTPIKSLAELLLADLDRIWSSLTKPAGLENSQISDFFDFEFAALPHKILQAEKFEEETKILRKRFREVGSEEELVSGNSSIKSGTGPLGNDGAVFLPAYHRRIPADGFPMYAEGIWSQIITNKDLDLPTQQELLAQYRCDEISSICMQKFDMQMAPFEESSRAGKGVLSGLGPVMKSARKECLSEFEESAGRYYKPVFKRKREELIAKIDGRLKALVVLQLSELHKRAVKDFEDEVVQVLKLGKGLANGSADGSVSYDFKTIVDTARDTALSAFMDEAEEVVLAPEENSSWAGYETEELNAVKKDMDVVAARLRVEEMKRLVTRLERTLKLKLGEGIALEFSKMAMKDSDLGDGKGLWDGIWKIFQKEITEGVKVFKKKADGFNAGEEEIKVGIWRLKRRGWSILKTKVDEEVGGGNLLLKLRENFEDRFRYDEAGVPRVWKPSDDIESYYTRAREATVKLIPLVSEIKLTSTSAPPPLTDFIGPVPADAHLNGDDDAAAPFPSPDEFLILSEAKQVELTTRFKRTADALYVEAKRSTISSVASIPVYFYALLLALGWNEIWAVLRSPIYFMVVLILAALGYVIYTLNLVGPMLRVGNAMMTQGVEIAREKLREFVDAPDAGKGKVAVEAGEEVGMMSLDKKGRTKAEEDKPKEDEDW